MKMTHYRFLFNLLKGENINITQLEKINTIRKNNTKLSHGPVFNKSYSNIFFLLMLIKFFGMKIAKIEKLLFDLIFQCIYLL